MDPNITVKIEPCDEDNTMVPFDSYFSEINKIEVEDCKEVEPHVTDIKMEDGYLSLSNNIHDDISLINRISENGISTEPMKRKMTNSSSSSLKYNTENEKVFSCPMCNIAFVEISTFIGHLNAVHKGDALKKCPICDRKFNDRILQRKLSHGAVTVHMWEHSIEEYQSCPQMKVVTEMKITTPKEKIEYYDKAIASNTKKDIKVDGEYLCPLCSKSYTVLADLINHIDVHKQVKQSFCSVCNLQFKTDDELRKHMQTHEIEKINSVQGNKLKSFQEKVFATQDRKRKSTNKASLIYHTDKINENGFSCPICKIAFVEIATFIGHLNAVHKVDGLKSCPVCERDFSKTNFGSITVHMWEHSITEYQSCPPLIVTEIPIKSSNSKKIKFIGKTIVPYTNMGVKSEGENLCPLCRKSHTDLADLISHIDVHKKVKQSFCRICKLQFKTDNELNKHMQTHETEKVNLVEGKGFKDTINTSSKRNQEIEKYDSLIHNTSFGIRECVMEKKSTAVCKEKHIYCPVCLISFIDNTTMISHFQRSHHCPVCGMFLASKTDMDEHIKSHVCQTCLVGKSMHQLKSYTNKLGQENNCCIVCKSEYYDKYLIYACNICKKSFTKPLYLIHHVVNHTDCYRYTVINEKGSKEIIKELVETPYYCMLCQISFKNNQNFLEHTDKIHSYHKKNNLYTCSICGAGFKTLIELETHREKPYVCNICNMSFGYKISLLMHIRNHTQGKPSSCNVCNKRFRYNSRLVRHLKTHTEYLPCGFYSCDVCKESFTTRRNLTSHHRTSHNLHLMSSQITVKLEK